MSQTYTPLTWDEAANRYYEYGVSKGVLYRQNSTDGAYTIGKAWNGLINITDKPTGADSNKLYADGIEYANMRATEEYEASIEAYTYPDEFAECDGSATPIAGMFVTQQTRKVFGLCWRTEVGSAANENAGYQLHLAYGLTASPAERSHDTVNDSPEAATMSWDIEGSPVTVTGYKPTAKIVIDSRKADATKLAALETILYGSSTANARLPLPDEVKTTLTPASDDD